MDSAIMRMLVRDLTPAWLRPGRTAFPSISRIAGELQTSIAALRPAKLELYGLLKRNFEATAAQALTLKILNLLLAQRAARMRSVSVASVQSASSSTQQTLVSSLAPAASTRPTTRPAASSTGPTAR